MALGNPVPRHAGAALQAKEYKVQFEIFEAPLALLLYLVKHVAVDIYDISVERITPQYLGFIG